MVLTMGPPPKTTAGTTTTARIKEMDPIVRWLRKVVRLGPVYPRESAAAKTLMQTKKKNY